MTSAGWNDVLDPLMAQPPDCDPDYKVGMFDLNKNHFDLTTNLINISATKKGTREVYGPHRRSQICYQKVPNLTPEGPKLYLRSDNGIKKEENA